MFAAEHHDRVSIKMMEWWQSTTPTGRNRSFRVLDFIREIDDPPRFMAISMVGETQLSWILARKS